MIQSDFYVRGHVLKKGIGLSILLIILLSGSTGATEITQCGKIVSSGDYELTRNIWNAGNSAVLSCINITTSDVNFDGANHFVVGNSAAVGTIGVYINTTSLITNVTVKNLNLTNLSYGFYLRNSSNNNLTGNNVSNNSIGIYLWNSSNNNIYNNYFNNTINVTSDGNPNYWNTTKQSGINIINGTNLGGNYWASPNGNGFSQNCEASTFFEGICALSFFIDANNIDHLALTTNTALPPTRYIYGIVRNESGDGISGVNVSITGGDSNLTNETGFYSFYVPDGTYVLTATYDIRYYTNTTTVLTTGQTVVEHDINLVKKPTGNISGRVVRYNSITIESPQSIVYHATHIPLNASSDRSVDKWNYSLNGEQQVTFTPYETTISAIQGWNNLVVYARSSGNWDSNSVSFLVDSIPPASVTGLHNVSYEWNYINWTWIDPQDDDFARVKVYLDGVYQRDVSKGEQYFNASVTPGTYTIGTITVDNNGTENVTMQTHTATTILPVERFIIGTVLDKENHIGIKDVNVSTQTGVSNMTNETGFYSLEVIEGTFNIRAELDPEYYTNSSVTVSTALYAVVRQDIELLKKPTGNITGRVTE